MVGNQVRDKSVVLAAKMTSFASSKARLFKCICPCVKSFPSNMHVWLMKWIALGFRVLHQVQKAHIQSHFQGDTMMM